MPAQQQDEVKEFNFFDYVDSLYAKLPKELQTDDRYNDLANQANDIIMGIIGDSMNKKDLENFMEQASKGLDIQELIADHLKNNPGVIDLIIEELTNLDKIVTDFSQI